MKIIHLYRDILGPSGVPYEVRELAAHQQALGHSVVTVFRGDQTNSDRTSNELCLRGNLSDLPKLRDVLRTFQPDIAHFTGSWIPCHNLWVTEIWKAKIPYIFEPHGSLNPLMERVRFSGRSHENIWFAAKRGYRILFDSSLMRRASGTRVLSEYEHKLAYGFKLKKPFIVPSGVDSEWFPTNVPNYEKHGPIKLFYIGRLDPYQKGFDLLLDSFDLLKKKNYLNLFKVLFVGPSIGDSMAWLRNEVSKRGLTNFTITDGVYGNAKHELFNKSDLFLHPSRFEGFAKTAREAMAHGLPILSNAENNLGDWVASESMGIVVRLNAEDIANKIESILNSSGRTQLSEMGKHARDFATRISWNRVAKDVSSNYENILSGL